MPYTPDATDVTQPADAGVKAATAAAEFRTVKLYMRDVLLAGLNLKAPLASPAFTGNAIASNLTVNGALQANGSAAFAVSPTAPTPTFGDASNKVATMAALAALALSTAMPGAATGTGLSITSDGTSPQWGHSAAEALAVLTYLGL